MMILQAKTNNSQHKLQTLMEATKTAVPFTLPLTYFCVIGFGILNLIPIDFPYVHHHTHVPRYDEDDHDVCRASGWIFAVNITWYVSLIASIFVVRHAIKQDWGQRIVMYPNLITGCLGLIGCAWLFHSYSNHSEEGFGMAMGFINGLLLIIIGFISLTIVNIPVQQGFRYGRSMLLYTTGPALPATIAVAAYEKQPFIAVIAMLLTGLFIHAITTVNSHANKEPFSKTF